jgi:hypothetical protein
LTEEGYTNVRSNGHFCMARDACQRGIIVSVRTHIGIKHSFPLGLILLP